MCIVAIAHRHSSRYPLIVAANRDERHARPSLPADWWDGPGSLLAGRDLVAGGSWLGVSGRGRFAAVTNIFEPGVAPAPRSRGGLVTEFLRTPTSPADFIAARAADGAAYGPYHLVVRDGEALGFVSNRSEPLMLAAGIHVFSNNAPGMRWAKLDRLTRALEAAAEREDTGSFLIGILSGPAARGPRESAAEHLFVADETFGTRCTTIVTIDTTGVLSLVEQTFGSDGSVTDHRSFEHELGGGA